MERQNILPSFILFNQIANALKLPEAIRTKYMRLKYPSGHVYQDKPYQKLFAILDARERWKRFISRQDYRNKDNRKDIDNKILAHADKLLIDLSDEYDKEMRTYVLKISKGSAMYSGLFPKE
jgi:hypothetical protein